MRKYKLMQVNNEANEKIVILWSIKSIYELLNA